MAKFCDLLQTVLINIEIIETDGKMCFLSSFLTLGGIKQIDRSDRMSATTLQLELLQLQFRDAP